MDQPYKFEVVFRGQQVIIEYWLDWSGEIDGAVISDDTPNFIHPDYEGCSSYLDEFHCEVYGLTKKHLAKISLATTL